MTQKKTAQEKFKQLRRQAGDLLTDKGVACVPADNEDLLRLVQELQTFQIELECQNEELNRSRSELMESKIRYTELYDSSPVGYATINKTGLILRANLTLASLLGTDRASLISMWFSDHIIFDDKDIFYRHRQHLLNATTPQTCELRMKTKSGTPFHVRLESTHVSGENGELQYRIVIVENSEYKKAQIALNELNKALNQKVKKRTRKLKQLNEHLIYTEQRERNAIASELHDNVVQNLAMSISKIKGVAESHSVNNKSTFSAVQEHLEQSLQYAQLMIYQLCPPVLKDFDIVTALGFLIEENNKKYNADVRFINNSETSIDLNEVQKVFLYRAVNELYLNVIKHSGVKEGNVELWTDKTSIRVSVNDKGAGFDANKISETLYGFGLYALAERLENMNGQLKIDSSVGKGTTITLNIPQRENLL